MSAKSVFRLTAQSPKYKDPIMNTSFPPRSIMGHDDTVFMGFDTSAAIRNSPQMLWQSLTPELRAEALRRAHLIHLLRQVNPNLQLCRKSLPSQAQPSTAEKAIQVPDIRYEFANNRRYPNRPDIKRSASFTAPGVRIQPSPHQPLSPIDRAPPPQFNEQPSKETAEKNSLDAPNPNHDRSSFMAKESTLQVTIKTTPNVNISKSPQAKEDSKQESGEAKEKEKNQCDQKLEKEPDVLVVDGNKESEKTERQVVVKNKDASSGDEDSVVVVLNQPRSEQGLERKYGQFFCRRCLRGWSSRSVWCVRHTCKVYIKQTCNMCNKLVNPYLVCRLPPISNPRKGRK